MRIGIDLGGSHIGIGLVNSNNEIVDKIDYVWTIEEKSNLWSIVSEKITNLIHEILNRNNLTSIEMIGIGFPKSNIIDGVVYIKENIVIDLVSMLEPIFNTKVYVRNDVKCSGTCEKKIGNLKEYDNALFMTLGTGIGGAYFYKNELVTPNTYPGMEIGHMIIQISGKECRCGKKGCFEEYASMRAFRNRIREVYNIEDVNSEVVLNLYNNKEKPDEMNKIVDEYIEYLSIGLINLINIFEPDAICIGGSFVHYEEIFMKKLEQRLKEKLRDREIPKLLLSKYGNDAGIIGASMIQKNN